MLSNMSKNLCFFNIPEYTKIYLGNQVSFDLFFAEETGFEPATRFPVRNRWKLNALRFPTMFYRAPYTNIKSDGFEPISLRVINPKICSQGRIRTCNATVLTSSELPLITHVYHSTTWLLKYNTSINQPHWVCCMRGFLFLSDPAVYERIELSSLPWQGSILAVGPIDQFTLLFKV